MTVVPLNYTCSDGLIVLHAIARSWPVQKFVIFGWVNKVLEGDVTDVEDAGEEPQPHDELLRLRAHRVPTSSSGYALAPCGRAGCAIFAPGYGPSLCRPGGGAEVVGSTYAGVVYRCTGEPE